MTEEYVKGIAIEWMQCFIELSKRRMIPYISGILNSTLPCLSSETSRLKGFSSYLLALTNVNIVNIVFSCSVWRTMCAAILAKYIKKTVKHNYLESLFTVNI